MICFRTGTPPPPGQSSGLWLFVVDRSELKDAPPPNQFQFATVNQLFTAVWTEGEKFYPLATGGDGATRRKFLCGKAYS